MDTPKVASSIKKSERIMYEAQKKWAKSDDAIGDGTSETYLEVVAAGIRACKEKYDIADVKKIKFEHIKGIIEDKIAAGESDSTINKWIHGWQKFEKACNDTQFFGEKEIHYMDKEVMKEVKIENSVKRSYKDSHRIVAVEDDCLKVINEMEKRNPDYADVARVQVMLGLRVSEAWSLKPHNIDLENKKVYADNAKGGLNNVVWLNHLTQDDLSFLKELKERPITDVGSGRIFARMKDSKGNYVSDDTMRTRITKAVSRAASKVGLNNIETPTGTKTFSSHTFRGAFAIARSMEYATNSSTGIDRIIEEKIKEQPRLKAKHQDFEKRIREKVKFSEAEKKSLENKVIPRRIAAELKEMGEKGEISKGEQKVINRGIVPRRLMNEIVEQRRNNRVITDVEKVLWLTSTDIHHSRQEITRVYVPIKRIEDALAKRI